MRKLSKTSSQIDGQPMFKLLDKIKKLESNGKDIIHFEIGDPDFDTPKNISDATINALKKWTDTLCKFIWVGRTSTKNL